MPLQALLTTEKVCERYGFERHTLTKLIRENQILCMRVGNKNLFRECDLLEFEERCMAYSEPRERRTASRPFRIERRRA